MTSKAKTGPLRLSIPKTSSKSTKSQLPSRNNSSSHDFMDISRTLPDDDYTQDAFSLSPTFHGHTGFNDFGHWAFNDGVLLSSDISSTSEATEESFDTRSIQAGDYDMSDTQMLPFSSCSPPLFPKADGSVDQSLPELSQIPGLSSSQDSSPQLCFSNPQGYQNFSTLTFPFDNETMHRASGINDGKSVGLNMASQRMIKSEPFAQVSWDPLASEVNGVPNVTLSGSRMNRLPATPPEGNQDLSATSACTQTYTFPGQDGSSYLDVSDTSSLSTQNFSIGEPFYPLTPPLTEQDPNRTIRPQKQSHRPILSAAVTCPSDKESDFFSLHQPLGQKPKDSADGKNPRDHAFYSLPTRSDGKYHCPYSNGENPCKHTPTTQKCTYHKYLDSHLKPYRCKVPQCVDAHFSSNACLFRHEREAHGMHGHGENPHLCRFPSCDRSIPGNGFPRRWNLHDHMRRVHDYTCSEKASSPEGSPITTGKAPATKKKDGTLRKRKGAISGTQTIKRVRATQSQSQAALRATHAHTDKQLQNAEKNYYSCLSDIQKDLGNINPQDPAMHERINARLQELHTHALNYRYIKASQLATKRGSGASS
ncbi:predicted protein [Uncinocarpus reesii 1704]|uniref:C2H2-type domain-containing protein n=1 Tax=Uncinocarpus reesii (strain UAMH 1704) TaxID=336963 RepID=C4JKX4_UNCRE|nr:uncharacterized protein UREG_00207 [Uncinocarpus reesii 1704]EEP75361.1 predicted protein [Uncinocarpus reesii 1704]